VGPARMIAESLTPKPGIREQNLPVADQPLAAVVGQLVGMAAEQGRHFGLDGLRQKRSRAVAQNRVGKCSVTAYHSFRGEVEASNTPAIRRLIITPHAVTNLRQ
jgi:hypothetical protein